MIKNTSYPSINLYANRNLKPASVLPKFGASSSSSELSDLDRHGWDTLDGIDVTDKTQRKNVIEATLEDLSPTSSDSESTKAEKRDLRRKINTALKSKSIKAYENKDPVDLVTKIKGLVYTATSLTPGQGETKKDMVAKAKRHLSRLEKKAGKK